MGPYGPLRSVPPGGALMRPCQRRVLGLAGKAGTGQWVGELRRLDPDGVVDSTFPEIRLAEIAEDALVFRVAMPVALEASGAIVVAAEGSLSRRDNPEPATQSLVLEGTTITWLRGGSSPEILQARFQYSVDGTTWTDLGMGSRIAGGWNLDGVSVPRGARLRAIGFVSGASWYVETMISSPLIVTQPKDLTVDAGASAYLWVSAEGDEPLSSQWFRDGVALQGAQGATVRINDLTWRDGGDYSVRVSNPQGSVTSQRARLTVRDPVILTQPVAQWLNVGDTRLLVRAQPGTDSTSNRAARNSSS